MPGTARVDGPRARLGADRRSAGRGMGPPLRPRRLPARRHRLPPCPPGPGIRRILFGELTIDSPERRHDLPRGRVVVRGRRASRARNGVRDGGDRVRARDARCRPSGRASGRSAISTRPTRRSRSFSARRSSSKHRSRMTRSGGKASSTSSSCTASSSRSASRARATSRPRRAPRLADPPDHVPARGGGGEHGGGVREADGEARHLLRHARPGLDTRGDRRAHGRPGLDADDPLRRPGAAGAPRSRRVPGARLPGRSSAR